MSMYESPDPLTLNSIGNICAIALTGEYSSTVAYSIAVCVPGTAKTSSSDFVHSQLCGCMNAISPVFRVLVVLYVFSLDVYSFSYYSSSCCCCYGNDDVADYTS